MAVFLIVLASCNCNTDFFSTPNTTQSFPRTPTCEEEEDEDTDGFNSCQFQLGRNGAGCPRRKELYSRHKFLF